MTTELLKVARGATALARFLATAQLKEKPAGYVQLPSGHTHAAFKDIMGRLIYWTEVSDGMWHIYRWFGELKKEP